MENQGKPPEQVNQPSGDRYSQRPQNSSTWNATPLLLQKKAEVFLTDEVYPCLQRFPKAERFSICQEIKQTMSRVIMNSIRSNVKTRSDVRLAIYEDIDADLKYMLVLTSVSRSQKYVTEGKAMQWQDKVAEMGRILGGLIKAARTRASAPR
jgi:hypothetical protein